MRYELFPTTQFKKDLKRIQRRGYDIARLEQVLEILIQDQDLPAKYKDHTLTGNYTGFRECHITPDWLLIYKKENNLLILTLSRTGTHSDLF